MEEEEISNKGDGELEGSHRWIDYQMGKSARPPLLIIGEPGVFTERDAALRR